VKRILYLSSIIQTSANNYNSLAIISIFHLSCMSNVLMWVSLS